MKGLIKCKCNRAVAPKHRSGHARLRCLMGQEKKTMPFTNNYFYVKDVNKIHGHAINGEFFN